MSYLITQSLLSAFGYTFDAYDGEGAYESFLKTLKREPIEKTAAMTNGIEFENEVYKAALSLPRRQHPKWEAGIESVAGIIKTAPVQVKAHREITVGGVDFLVYGILDALKEGVIYDVKFSSKSFGSAELAGKYLNSPQHPTYLYLVPEAYKFEYLVSDGKDLYRESYDRQETQDISEIIAEFLSTINEMGLLDIYKKFWLAK